MRKNKGITLIALVITIIVLLILAGVALSMVAGNEGILTKAEKAVSETNIAGAKEQVELMIAELSADYYEKKFVDKTESGKLVDYIKNALTTAKPTSNGEFSVSIDGNGKVSVIDKDGNSVVSGSLDENGKIIWDGSTGGNGGSGSGEVTPEETDAKYFTFEPNEDGTTATITGVKDEYAEKVELEWITATLVIKDGENYIKDVVLPSKIKDEAGNEYTVTAIGEAAFYGESTGSEVSQFTSFVIPDTVENIGIAAFGDCVSLNSVTLGSCVTSIGESAFLGCTSLSSINIPASVTSIGRGAFLECTSLSSINIPNSVTSIGEETFAGCESLSSINIPASVTSIGSRAFSGCTSLSSINIPNSVTSIGEETFAWCESLSSINIPQSVTSIGDYAFNGCTSLSTITVAEGNTVYDSRDNSNAIIETATNTLVVGCKNTNIPESVTSIGMGAFCGCTSLSSINIPASVTSIGDSAFYGCTSLSSINIPGRVTSIGEYTFAGCTSLSSINIPASVTSIGRGAFNGCTSLSSLTVHEGNSVYDSRDNSNAIIETETNTLVAGCKTTVIPTSVTSIGQTAFRNCTSLSSITIPASVRSWGGNSFTNCANLTTVTIDSHMVTWLDANSGLIKNATTIYVKSGLTVSSYVTTNFTEVASDKEGYVKYTKK